MIALIAKFLIARNPAMTLSYARRLAKIGLIIAGVAILIGAALWWNASQVARDERNQEVGASSQRESDLRETINRTERANEAAAKIERDPVARRDGCLRHSRTPENC